MSVEVGGRRVRPEDLDGSAVGSGFLRRRAVLGGRVAACRHTQRRVAGVAPEDQHVAFLLEVGGVRFVGSGDTIDRRAGDLRRALVCHAGDPGAQWCRRLGECGKSRVIRIERFEANDAIVGANGHVVEIIGVVAVVRQPGLWLHPLDGDLIGGRGIRRVGVGAGDADAREHVAGVGGPRQFEAIRAWRARHAALPVGDLLLRHLFPGRGDGRRRGLGMRRRGERHCARHGDQEEPEDPARSSVTPRLHTFIQRRHEGPGPGDKVTW